MQHPATWWVKRLSRWKPLSGTKIGLASPRGLPWHVRSLVSIDHTRQVIFFNRKRHLFDSSYTLPHKVLLEGARVQVFPQPWEWCDFCYDASWVGWGGALTFMFACTHTHTLLIDATLCSYDICYEFWQNLAKWQLSDKMKKGWKKIQLKLLVVKWSEHIIHEVAKHDALSYIEQKKRRVAKSRVTLFLLWSQGFPHVSIHCAAARCQAQRRYQATEPGKQERR